MAGTIYSLLRTPVEYLVALRDLLFRRELRRHLIRTVLLGAVTWISITGIFLLYKQELFHYFIGNSAGIYSIPLFVLFFIAGLVLSAILSIVVVFIGGAVFLEALVVDVFAIEGVVLARPPGLSGFISTMMRGVIASIVFLVPVMLLFTLSVLFSFIPPLAVISFLLGALALGLSLLDLPQSVRGTRIAERFSAIFRRPLETMALGACFSALLFIPLGSVIFLPVGTVVAVRKITRWNKLEDN